MMNKIALKIMIPFLFALAISCSGDDNATETEPNTLMTLNRQEIFQPNFENYETKRILHYDENNKVVADTTYDNSGIWISYVTRSATPSTAITTTVYANGEQYPVIRNYDALKRLIGVDFGPNYQCTFSYDENSITATYSDEEQTLELYQYTYNSLGLIETRITIPSPEDAPEVLFYEGDVPISMSIGGATIGNFTYFDNLVPENLKRTVIERNNSILAENQMETAPHTANRYMKTYSFYGRFEREFNALNYQVYKKDISIDTNQNNLETVAKETFFYYN